MTIEQQLSTPLAYIESAGVSLPRARMEIAECLRALCREIEALKYSGAPGVRVVCHNDMVSERAAIAKPTQP